MNGFKAFKYYTSIKLHFTSPKFNVFVNRGHVKGSQQRFLMRNDYLLFEKLARQYPTDKDFIQYIASNFMYGNTNVVYDSEQGITNYREYLRRRQSITRVFVNDLDAIVKSGAQLEFNGSKIPDLLKLYMSKEVTIETLVILDDLHGILDQIKQNNHLQLVLGGDILTIEKAKGFVKYDSYKIMTPYISFLEEIQGTVHG